MGLDLRGIRHVNGMFTPWKTHGILMVKIWTLGQEYLLLAWTRAF